MTDRSSTAAALVGIALAVGAATVPARVAAGADRPGDHSLIIVGGDVHAEGGWRMALAGKPVIAVRYVDVGANCRATGAKVLIVAPAFHGIVSVTPGSIVPDQSPPGNLQARLSHCGMASAPTQDVTYVSDPGFVGQDAFQIEVDGASQIATRIGIGVVAGPGEAPFGAPPEDTNVGLPEGALLGVAAGHGGATFIDLEHSAVRDGIASIRTYTVYDPPLPPLKGKRVLQDVGNVVIDCAHRTYIEHRSYGFDEAGNQVIWTSGNSVEPIEAKSANDRLASVMCDGVRMPLQAQVRGHAAALELARAAIRKGGPLF